MAGTGSSSKDTNGTAETGYRDELEQTTAATSGGTTEQDASPTATPGSPGQGGNTVIAPVGDGRAYQAAAPDQGGAGHGSADQDGHEQQARGD